MKTKTDPNPQNQIRMSVELKARIHKYRARLEKETGLHVNFSAATRSLIEKMLDTLGIK